MSNASVTHAEAPPDQQAPIEVSLLDLSIALAQRNALAQLFGLVAIAGIGYFHQLWVVPLVLILLGVVIALWRVQLAKSWLRCTDKTAQRHAHARGFFGMSAAGGLANAIAIFSMYGVIPPQAGAVILLITVGAISVGVLHFSLVRFASAAYMLPSFGATILASALDPTFLSKALLVITPVFALISMRASTENYQSVVASIRRQLDLDRTIAALEEARQAAEAGNRAKSQFLATMSHEIRTPMNGVIGALEMISASPLDDKQRVWLDVARSSGVGLVCVINDVLDYSKLEAGKMRIISQAFDIRKSVSNATGMFVAEAQRKGLEFAAHVDPAVPRVLSGDAVRLGQILINLVGNAIKFTNQGTVGLSVSVEPDRANIDRICLSFVVSDTGIGIGAEHLGRIFEPFYQTDQSYTREVAGSGLGLAICQQLIAAMNGSLSVSSEPSIGTRFSVTLPFGEATDATVASGYQATTPVQGIAAANAALPVLVVEDNGVNRFLLRGMVESLGHRVDEAADGEAAFALWNERRHPVVLMDCQMPRLDGFGATMLIRDEERHTGIAPCWIIAVTGNALDGDRQRCLDAGMNAFLAKPFVAEELAAAIAMRTST